jgi:hypothetical protein
MLNDGREQGDFEPDHGQPSAGHGSTIARRSPGLLSISLFASSSRRVHFHVGSKEINRVELLDLRKDFAIHPGELIKLRTWLAPSLISRIRRTSPSLAARRRGTCPHKRRWDGLFVIGVGWAIADR